MTGSNFLAGSSVTADGMGVAVSNVSVVSGNILNATFSTAPGAPGGLRNVTVTTADGTSNSQVFTVVVLPPTLTSIQPTSTDPGTSLGVVIDGTDFTPGSTVSVSGSGVTVGTFNVNSSTRMVGGFSIASGAAPGPRQVTVTNAIGVSNALTFTVNSLAQPPTLSAMSPGSGLIGSTVPATLNGAHFDATAAVNLSGSGVTVVNLQLVSANQLMADFVVAGNAPAGGRTVTVTTANGTSNGLTFTVNLSPPPTLTSITPAVMNPGKTVLATVTGTNFVAGATSMNFTTGTGVTLQNLTVLDPTQFTVEVVLASNASLGGHFFTVTTPAGTSNSKFFDVLREPVITSLVPNSAAPGSSVTVSINGANFYNTATVAISGTGVTLSNIVRVNNSLITATFTVAAGAAPGPRDVTVTTHAGVSPPVPFTVQ